jgi:hypothetical protein
MSECITDEPLPVSLTLLPHFNDALGEHFACRRSLVIRGKRAARFLDRVPCSVESRCQKYGRVRIKGCICEKRIYRHSGPHYRSANVGLRRF